MTAVIDLNIPKMAIALGMVAIAISFSVWQKLAIAKSLLIATFRRLCYRFLKAIVILSGLQNINWLRSAYYWQSILW